MHEGTMLSFLHKLVSPAPAPGAQALPGALAAAPAQAPPPERWAAPAADFIGEEGVTPEAMLRQLRQAFFAVETVPGNDYLRVCGEAAVRLRVTIDAERRLLQLSAAFGLAPSAPMDEKLRAANRLNERVVCLRASIADETTLMLDHHVVIAGGAAKAAIVAAVRRMDRMPGQVLADVFGRHLLA